MSTQILPKDAENLPLPPVVSGLPIIGSTIPMSRDPGRFFKQCYDRYGPAFRVKVFGNEINVIAGADAANFVNGPEGRECLRSREVFHPLAEEFGATKVMTGVDGKLHMELRNVMRRGFSRDSLKGLFQEMVDTTRDSLLRDWKPGTDVPVVEAMQYLVIDQLGMSLTGYAPREYVKDIRTTILYILNVLVTHQRPRIMLQMPEYKRAKARMMQLARQMVEDVMSRPEPGPDERKTLIDDIVAAHKRDPELIPAGDLPMLMAGPYVAGLDTVANTTSAIVYTILKHPEVLARVQAEVDAVFSRPIDEATFMDSMPALRGAIMETMRLYPIAVAQLRVANKDFVFGGHLYREGQFIYLATAVPHLEERFYPDADAFDIERYSEDRKEHMQSGAYSPYGRGPQTCAGRTQADVLLMMTMGELFYLFDLELTPADYVMKIKTAPTPGPEMGFRVKVKRRRN